MASAASPSTADDSYLSLSSDLGKTKLLCDETKEQHSFPKENENFTTEIASMDQRRNLLKKKRYRYKML